MAKSKLEPRRIKALVNEIHALDLEIKKLQAKQQAAKQRLVLHSMNRKLKYGDVHYYFGSKGKEVVVYLEARDEIDALDLWTCVDDIKDFLLCVNVSAPKCRKVLDVEVLENVPKTTKVTAKTRIANTGSDNGNGKRKGGK